MADQLLNGSGFRILTLVASFTLESVVIRVGKICGRPSCCRLSNCCRADRKILIDPSRQRIRVHFEEPRLVALLQWSKA
jgi:hypothetical protein